MLHWWREALHLWPDCWSIITYDYILFLLLYLLVGWLRAFIWTTVLVSVIWIRVVYTWVLLFTSCNALSFKWCALYSLLFKISSILSVWIAKRVKLLHFSLYFIQTVVTDMLLISHRHNHSVFLDMSLFKELRMCNRGHLIAVLFYLQMANLLLSWSRIWLMTSTSYSSKVGTVHLL